VIARDADALADPLLALLEDADSALADVLGRDADSLAEPIGTVSRNFPSGPCFGPRPK
jgi:hypothetical protein